MNALQTEWMIHYCKLATWCKCYCLFFADSFYSSKGCSEKGTIFTNTSAISTSVTSPATQQYHDTTPDSQRRDDAERRTSLHHMTNQLRCHMIPILSVQNVEDSFAEERDRSSGNTMRGVAIDNMMEILALWSCTPVHMQCKFQHSCQYCGTTVRN